MRGDHAATLQELIYSDLKDGGPLFVALNRAQLWTDHRLAPYRANSARPAAMAAVQRSM
jgi:hypothetical protein